MTLAGGDPAPRRGCLRRLLVAVAVAAAVALVLAGGTALIVGGRLRASLPRLDGEVALPGLAAAIRVERDHLGVPSIQGATREDVARALGFLHAQERFFQMDLLRRSAAGELAELLGPALLPADREVRLHRFRLLAERIAASAEGEALALLAAYTEGVNAGLESLGSRPFEYHLLRADPQPWRREDVTLVVLAMFLDLHDWRGRVESTLGVIHDTLPPALASFLSPRGTEWDAPLEGQAFPVPPVPGPEAVDLRGATSSSAPSGGSAAAGDATSRVAATGGTPPLSVPGGHPASAGPADDLLDLGFRGSNNWAVSGAHTASGLPLVANDMHLGHSVPNIWYRAAMSWTAADGSTWRAAGVTLPGVPFLVAGSNGRVAWGFTNSYADLTDLVILETDPEDPDLYRAPGGPARLEHHQEILHVHGGDPETLDVAWTAWGPVVGTDHRGRRLALRWTAHDAEAVNAGHARLETARNLEEAFAAAHRAGSPPQNLVAVDAGGRIGWTILGALPRRAGHDGRLPSSWADGARGWRGWLDPEDYPRVVDPAGGWIWTANNRVAGGDALGLLGDGGYDLGARAGQIRDDLVALDRASEADMLAIQLDDRARFLERWRDLLRATLDDEALATDPHREEMRRLVEDWGGRAAVDSPGYRLVRGFRIAVAERVLGFLTAGCRETDPTFRFWSLPYWEGPLWRVLAEKPEHLLDPRYTSWHGLLLEAADGVRAEIAGEETRLADHPWGERNTLRMRHPLSYAVPALGRWLDMPPRPLPGDSHMPRVQGPGFGASERFAVSPGKEETGYLHMPGGQSAHPLSPFYRAGHDAWAEGKPLPFLPGPPAHTLTLLPSEARGMG